MKFKLEISDVKSEGPFSIWTLSLTDIFFVQFRSNVPKDDLINGLEVDIPDDTRQIKLINNSPCCLSEMIYYVPYTAPRPSNTPTPSFTSSPTPTPTPTSSVTPTPTTTPTPTPTMSLPVIELTTKPSWINILAFTHDINTREFTLYANAVDISVRIIATTGEQPSGISTNGLIWDSTTWLPGSTQFAAPTYTELFRLNPTIFGQGSIKPSTPYTFFIRRASDPNTVYKFNFTTLSTSSVSGPVNFVLP